MLDSARNSERLSVVRQITIHREQQQIVLTVVDLVATETDNLE